MSFISNLRDKYITQPVLNKVLTGIKTSATPNIFAVPIGFNTSNLENSRRQTYSTISFETLRRLSISHETSRAAINARKRQISQLDWDIVDVRPESGEELTSAKRLEIQNRIKKIGGPSVRLREVMDKLLEDLLVLDAMVFYKQKTRGGELLRIIPIDGATIKLKVDQAGMVPLAPDVGYEQWVQGKLVAELTSEELTYEKMNPRTNSPYGLSPLESLVLTVDASLRASLYNTNYLSDNNVPQGFLSLPPEWTPQQIKEYKEFFDSMVSGPKDQAKIFPIPAGSNYQPTTKPKDFAFKDFFDYLDRKVAMLFDITPQELGLSLQQYKENAEGQDKVQMRKGLRPLAHFIEDVFTKLINEDFGYQEFAFKFKNLESRYSPEVVSKYLPLGIISVDDVRTDMGEPKLNVPNFVLTGGGPVLLSEIGQTTVSGTGNSKKNIPQQENEVKTPSVDKAPKADVSVRSQEEFKAWENKALHDIKKMGKVYRSFESEVLDEETIKSMTEKLAKAKSAEDVKRIFKAKNMPKVNPLDKIEKAKEYLVFKNKMKKALLKQIEPFTNVKTIDNATKTKKADSNNVEDYIDEMMSSFDGESIDEFLNWSAEQGGNNAYSSLGIDGTFKMTSDKFRKILADRKNYIIDSVDSTTKDYLVSMINNGKLEGLTNAEIAQRISDDYENISLERANMITRTEAANASMLTELEIYSENGVEKKVWVVSEDINDECGENESQGPIPLNEAFLSGDMAPPAHPNCRCYMQASFD